MKIGNKLRGRLKKATNNLMGVLGWLDANVKCKLQESKEVETFKEEREILRNARKGRELSDKTRAAIRAIRDVLKE